MPKIATDVLCLKLLVEHCLPAATKAEVQEILNLRGKAVKTVYEEVLEDPAMDEEVIGKSDAKEMKDPRVN